MRSKILFHLRFLFFCFVIYSCSITQNEQKNKLRDIVIILNKIPQNNKFKVVDGSSILFNGKHEISYRLDNGVEYVFYPKSREKDTLIIKNITSHIELQHKYKGIELLSFIIHKGDTISINYEGNMPILTIKNRKPKFYDYNYERYKHKTVSPDSISNWAIYKLPPLFLTSKKENIPFLITENYKKAKIELEKEKDFLNSLKAKNLLSKENFDFYNWRIFYRKKMLGNKDKKEISFKNIKQNDELLKYSFYREFIDIVMWKSVKQNNLHNKELTPLDIYDFIRVNKLISDKTKSYLLFKQIQRIIEQGTNEEINKYWKLFKTDCSKESDKINYLKKLYNLNENFSQGLDLVDLKDTKTTFKQLREKYKGKVLYIDFWASWCAPCRMILSESTKLHKELNSKDVVFIYLAIWDKERSWKTACKKENLYKNSFRVINAKTSTFIEKMKINSIPRYMLYDKSGKLYQKDAPRPNTKEIRSILKRLMK